MWHAMFWRGKLFWCVACDFFTNDPKDVARHCVERQVDLR